MNTPSSRFAVPPSDLFERWQAHRRAMAGSALSTARQAAPAGPVGLAARMPVSDLPALAPSSDDAARVVLAALAEQRAEQAARPPAPVPAPDPVAPVAPAPVAVSPASPTPLAVPGLVIFSPRRSARRAWTVVSAVLATAVAGTGLLAWEARTTTAYAVAGGLTVLLLAAWSARGRATGTQVSIEDGVLRVVQGTTQHRFPLTAAYPPIDVVGEPGDRGWKVLIQRKSMAPYVITRRMVDPSGFTDAIRRFRPNA